MRMFANIYECWHTSVNVCVWGGVFVRACHVCMLVCTCDACMCARVLACM